MRWFIHLFYWKCHKTVKYQKCIFFKNKLKLKKFVSLLHVCICLAWIRMKIIVQVKCQTPNTKKKKNHEICGWTDITDWWYQMKTYAENLVDICRGKIGLSYFLVSKVSRVFDGSYIGLLDEMTKWTTLWATSLCRMCFSWWCWFNYFKTKPNIF